MSKYSGSDARLVWRVGKNRDGYFTAQELCEQVDNAIDIFESNTKGFATGLFLFDNAPSHQKRAPDALSARKMVKFPAVAWTHHKNGPKMRPGYFANGEPQDFYYPDDYAPMPGWFKGMEQIIKERGLWPKNGLLAQCEGFKCSPGRNDCCCRHLLFTQPDFVAQKSQLQELVTSRGHLCDFYPKFHPELNFIEQYWGLSKFHYRMSPKTANTHEQEDNIVNALAMPSLLQIRRCAFHLIIPYKYSNPLLLDLPTGQLASFQPTLKGLVVLKLPGQIAAITAIAHYPQVW